MASALIATTIVAGVGLPHLLPQARLAPLSGAGLWLSVLALRALLALFLAMLVVLYVPATEVFRLLTHWCFHAVIPFIATHLGFSGHRLGDAATLVPGLVLAVSAVSALFAIWRGARAIRRWVRADALGRGPRECVIVRGSEVVVAAAGLRAPELVVSAGALTSFDEAELGAGLEHERGHIARRHRFMALIGELLFAVARPLPGSRRALTALHLHLERDADQYAVRRTGDPLALASAICKATESRQRAPALGALGGTGVSLRLSHLLAGARQGPGRVTTTAARGLAAVVTALTLAIALSGPAVSQAGLSQLQSSEDFPSCQG
jgi:Zn-dependent protease with chaperone function